MMEKYICTYAMIPVRALPAESAEMVTQILFGETYEILLVDGKWAKIRTVADDYPGWIDAKLIDHIDEAEVERWNSEAVYVTQLAAMEIGEVHTFTSSKEQNSFTSPKKQNSFCHFGDLLPMGCEIHSNGNWIHQHMPLTHWEKYFFLNGKEFCITTEHDIDFSIGIPGVEAAKSPAETTLSPSECARRLTGAPYLWGGKTVFGIDCSGLVQVAFKVCGIQLPRDASQMVKMGDYVAIGAQRENDLAFFSNENGAICHVGICLDHGGIIHSSGCVRVDRLDNVGIFNGERKTHTHKLACIKRIAMKG